MDTKISSLNDPPRLLSGSQCLHDLIRWDEHKDSCAIDFTSHDKRERYRYQDIQACVTSLVTRIQSALRSHHPSQQQHIVPILLPQSPGLYISQLAILQSGGAFCPINLDAPKDRIRFVVGDISASIIITTSEFRESVSWEDGPSIIVVDEFPAIPTELEDTNESREPISNDLAYVMYTSGSSGTPKGVAVSHLAASQSFLAHESLIPKFERFLQFAAPSFDVSVFEIFFPLTRGQTLVGCDRSQLLNDLPGMINELEIDAAELTPTVVGALLQKRAYVPKLRLLMTIGEMLTRPIVEEFGGSDTKESLLYGMYGPTEAAIHCTIHPKMKANAKPGNIGVPFETVSAFIAEAAPGSGKEQDLRFLPQGELGELILGGPQLANGYLNREEQNKAAFVTVGDKSYYRTGDKGRILEDGSIEIHGRMSGGQVKLRGQRVELGEIEDAVYKHSGIKTVVAVVLSGVLIVFALTNGDAMHPDQVLRTCSQWLPNFMVPSEIILLREFPYLPSGKVDKRSLEATYQQQREGGDELTNFTQIEVAVREVLHEMLGSFPSNMRLAAVGLDSLVSIKVSRDLRSRGFNVTTLAVLQAETLSSLVKICENCPQAPSSATMKTAIIKSDMHAMMNGDANDIEISYPCTPLQNAMLAETAIDRRAYQNWVELDIFGVNDIDYLCTKLHDLADHNSVLRTGFAESSDSSGYIQFVWKTFPDSHIETVDAFTHDFDVSEIGSLHRPVCFKICQTKPCLKLLIHIHHALYDAWSLDLLLDDLDCLLRDETPVSRPPFAEVVSGYIDGRLSSDSQASKDYWKDHMAHLELRHIPYFHTEKVESAGLAVANYSTQLSTLSIELAAKRMASSPQAIFQAAYALILASYLGTSDICFGTVFSGRTLPIAGIEDIIGPCLATLPIRIDTSVATNLQDLVEELNSTNRKHLEYSTLPLRDIKSVSDFEPRQQLFDTLLIWQQTLHSYDHRRKNVLLVDQVDQLEFNLTLEVTPTSNTIHFKANYQQSVFPESQIDMLLRQLEETTKAIIDHAEKSPNNVFNESNVGLLSVENPTPSIALGFETLISPVERIAKEDPDRAAIAFATRIDEENSDIQYMSYGSLNARANQLGHYLSHHGVFPNDIICICLEKSLEFYTSILATSKLGAGYLPVTPDIPQDRLQHILSEGKVKMLIGHSSSRLLLEKFAEQEIVYLDEIDLEQHSRKDLITAFKPENISYCVFTSGSTGTPKGVLVTQGNLLSNLDVLVEIYPATRDSKLLQSCSQAFDVSVFEIFFTWRIGGCLCFAVKDVLFRDLELAIRVLRVTHLSLTPTVAALINPQNVPKVEFLVTAGEAVTQKVFNAWANRGLYQGYGPSETTNICTVKPQVTSDDNIHNIGRPFKNTSAFVLAPNTEFSLVPRGGEGEFCFGGSQIFRGYMNRTQEEGKIIDNPKYGRLYKSGDFGRLMPDGSLVFTGRKDDQVKIRGQRVELGEINNVLISSPEVKDCVTMVINIKGSSQRLVCFFTSKFNASEDLLPLVVDPSIVSDLYQRLEAKLPNYMVPSNLVPISNLPSTSQGKIDKRRLISLYENFELKYLDSTTRASKSSKDHQWKELELEIRAILGEISKTSIEDIEPDTSFFSFGIDSISAIAFARKLNQAITKQVNISDILKYTSVVRLAEHLSISQIIEEGHTMSVDSSFELTEKFSKSTIAQFTKIGRIAKKVTPCTPLQEAMLSAAESSSGASYSNHVMFNIFGDLERLHGCWQEMVHRHEILRTCFISTDMQKFPYVQVVLEDFKLEFGSLDSSTLKDAIVEMEIHSTRNESTPPYSINVLYSDGEQLLLVSMHHALYDGVALAVLYDEVEKLYHEMPLPHQVSFTPFLQHMKSVDVESSDKFWESTLQGYYPLHFENVSEKTNEVQRSSTRIQQVVAKTPLSEIESKIKKHSTTPLAAFHTIWASTLSELFKTTDVCFGNVVSGRTAPVDGIERLVAPCFNTIPSRLGDLHKSTYLEAFRKLQNANADSLPFQFTPLRRLQSKFSPDGSRLFDTLFILQQPSEELDSSIWSIVEDNGAMDFPLVCEIIPKPSNDTLQIIFHSSTSILSENDAYNIIKIFENILEKALENPRRQIISSSTRSQIMAISEAREKKRRDLTKSDCQDKVMTGVELEVRDVIAGFTDVPLEKIGRGVSIFRLGLDSISTVQVASRLRAQGHNVLASDILQHPTIAQVASHLEQSRAFKSKEIIQFDFAAFDQKYRDSICSENALLNVNVEAIRPCTAVQQGMLAQSLHSNGHEYINSMSLEILPDHSMTGVKDAWIKVCKAHEMLRTTFAQTKDPEYPFVMITSTNESFVLPWFESREHTPSEDINRLRNPWSITVDQKENKTLLIFTAHHALYDAQSMQMIFSDFTKLFHCQAVLSRPSINKLLSSVLQATKGDQDEKRVFWEQPENRVVVNKFPDLTPLRVTTLSNAIREVKSLASIKELENRCRDLGVTMQAAGQASWARLLMSYTGENVTTFGMTLSGRSVCDDANMVTFPTIVTLPVNCNVTGSNGELLSRTMLSNAQLHKHQFTPLTSIQKWSGYPEGRIFDTLFAYQKLSDDKDVLRPPWNIVDEDATVDYVVSLEVQPSPSGEVIIRLSFREDIIPAAHAELMVKQFDALLLDTLKNPNRSCNIAPEVGTDLLSITPAQDPVLPDSVTLLHQYVERGAKTWPDKVALEFATCLEPGNYQSRKWTYEQLDGEANRVAQMLHTRGISPGEIIAICFDKCAEASFAIIGIMKAGCGYVALDPNAPADRLKFIVGDSAAKLIITAGNRAQTLRSFVDEEMIDLTDPTILHEFASEAPQLSREITPQDISYCLYTSGTTGTPKGCLLTHENAIQAMLAFQRLFDGHWTTDSKWLQFASFHFDVSVLEQFWSWSVGICVASAPRDLIFEDIPGAIQQLGITHIDLTPSLARLLHPDDVPSLCKGVFITGGEQLKQEILDVWGEHACIYNGYGPTEATIGVTMYPRVPKNGKPSNIGPQFDNVGSFVLKPGTELPVLRGAIGELCVSGKLVGKGYLNRPELTTEKFPTLSNFKERVYRTGDLVRILHDGTFLFLGRADDQVKLRGQRLELGEINEVIKKSRNDLEEVVTLVLKHTTQAKEQLVTFFVISGKNEPDDSGVVPFIRDACKSRLPGYMIPTHFILIKALPLNANNKADSKQLAAKFNNMRLDHLFNLSLSGQSHAGWTTPEKSVLEVIVKAFPVEVSDLTRSSNVFQLGLDSISMITFSQSLRDSGYRNATNATVRSNSTIGRLIEALLIAKPNEGNENAHLTAARLNISWFSQRHTLAICKELGNAFEQIESIAPCTPIQEGMIYKFLESDGQLYVNRLQYRLKLGVCPKQLAAAWDRVVSHLQILRTKFVLTNDGFAQVVIKSVSSPQGAASRAWKGTTDILKSPWSFEVAAYGDHHDLILKIFHGIYDGNSLGMILNHFSDEFHNVQNIQYGPAFHSALPHGPLGIVSGEETFWKSHLKTWSHHSLPHHYEDEGNFVFKQLIDLHDFESTRKALYVAPQATIQAAWISTLQMVFSLHTVGIIMSGRAMDFEGVEKVVGPLFNTVPFHLPIKSGTQMPSLIKECHRINMKMQDFQHTPLKLIRKWSPAGIGGQLFDTLFAFQRADVNEERFLNSLGREIDAFETNVADYPLALEATLNHDSTKLLLKIAAKTSAVPEVIAKNLLNEMDYTIQSILSGKSRPTIVPKIEPDDQQNLGVKSSLEPPPSVSQYQLVFSILTIQQQDIVCSEVAILAKVDKIHTHEPRSIFELGLDSIDVIKLSSRLRKNGIELSVSEIIKCQIIAKILEKARPSEAKKVISPSIDNLMKISERLDRGLRPLITGIKIERILPATPLQESMLKEMVESRFKRYFTVQVFKLNKTTEATRLMRAVDSVIEKSPILRTTFVSVQDPQSPLSYAQIVQKDWPKLSDSPPIIGNGLTTVEDLLETVKNGLKDSWASLEEKLFLISLVYCGKMRFISMAISHALYDGGSLPMIHNDIGKAYRGDEITERPCYMPYLAEVFNSVTEEAKDFWKATLWNSPPSIFPKQELSPTHEHTTHRHEKVSGLSLREIKTFCRSSNITLQTLGQTCWAVVLAELMGQLDVVFGAVLACRDTAEADQVNFPLFNTVAIRSVLRGTLDQMLQDMQEKSVATRQFQHFPLQKAQAYGLGSRDDPTKDTTLFDTLFTYQGVRPKKEEFPLYTSCDGSSDVEFAICVEMEIDDVSDSLYWTSACKSVARNLEQSKDILDTLDMILGRIMKNKQEQVFTIHPDGISICGFPKFQPRDIARPQKQSKVTPPSIDWSNVELKLRESISVLSGLPKEDIFRESTIFQLGLDSITVLKLPALLKKHNIHLIASEIMKYLTIRDIANYLLGKQEPQKDAPIDVETIIANSMLPINQSYLDGLQASVGQIKYVMPATAGQKYMIKHWQNSQGCLFYPTFKFKLCESVDAHRLDLAWFKLLSDYDILRTGFIISDTDSSIAQIVYQHPTNKISYRKEPPMVEDFMEFLDQGHLEDPPVRLFVTSRRTLSDNLNPYVTLHLVIHHALYDGISISLLIEKLIGFYEDPKLMSMPAGVENRWKKFVATTIQEKNEQSVKEQWIEYLGSACNNNKLFRFSPEHNLTSVYQPVTEGNEGPKRIEVFIPDLPAKRLKSLARTAGVSIDHLLIVMASRLIRRRQQQKNADASLYANTNGEDTIVGLYLANRFPFSTDLSSMLAPTLNLLPIKIMEESVDCDTPVEELARCVQKDLGKFGVGGWQVGEDGKAGEDNDKDEEKVVEKDKQAAQSQMIPASFPETPAQEESEKVGLLEPLVDREPYARAVHTRINREVEIKQDHGAYVPSIDIELNYHPDTETIDFGIFGPLDMIGFEEAQEWVVLLESQV
ncbi:nonribosomal peptide synthetase [Sclerotinia borealis F-4128]|uniref:Nonribosomal peptide synthetase n=1 Tax=Sclerotinia borealis (strain F-4128) TaxID=1432307 RepID=W9CDA0_SCLBF|nr:nonribosomal peptide synthetase [Sclerotinia borealis F-4128]